ncbi:MAG: hypothetical protein H6707_19755 [Deltaproteobacteria bacterium]|nr:hypothetical protein [Deltaproteobacteria bacterium]
MPTATEPLPQDLAQRRRGETASNRRIFDAAVLVLACNLWICFLLVPMIHLQRVHLGVTTTMLIAASLLLAIAGVALHSSLLLFAAFPCSLLLPVLLRSELVGINVYGPKTFVLVALSFVAFGVGGRLLFRLARAPEAHPQRVRRLAAPGNNERHWRRRWRIYTLFAAFTGLLPVSLLCGLFLTGDALERLRLAYPHRTAAAAVLFGILALAIYLAIFHLYVRVPLAAHVRGDGKLRGELIQTRRRLRRRVSVWSYAILGLGVAALVGLLLRGSGLE